MMKSILTTIVFLALAIAGLAQTRNVIVNTSGVVQSPTNFWSADASNARTSLGLGSAATNPASAFQPSSSVLTNLAASNGVNLANIPVAGVVGALATNGSAAGLTNFPTVPLASNVTGTIAISNGGSGATTAGGARTNLGATAIGNAIFTATNSSDAIDAIGLSTNFSDQILSVSNIVVGSFMGGTSLGFVVPTSGKTLTVRGTNLTTAVPAFFGWDGFSQTAFSAATARANLGLNAWTTNTNSPVFVGTNGEVVSPTNFWQVAPITTTFIESQPLTNSSTNISGSRFLHIHSLAPAIGGVTNTIVLPTNGTTFVGDVALIVHQGPTNSLTKVRTSGSTNDLVTMSRFDETVEFVYYNDQWQFNHNQSFIEPIYFSGTNATANAAASRTNLGLGTTNLVQFAYVESPYFFVSDGTNGIDFETDAVAAITRTNLGIGSGATNTVSFGKIRVPNGELTIEDPANDASIITFPVDTDPVVLGADYWNHASVRASIGMPLAALTNTNNANFQSAIFNTNSTPTNGANVNAVNFNTAIHWMEVNVVTNGVTNNFRIPLFK